MSEADVTDWINLNKIKINFTQTYWHTYWSPLNSQFEEIELTVKSIFRIKTETREKHQQTLNFSLPTNHLNKNSNSWRQKLMGNTKQSKIQSPPDRNIN